MKRTIYLLFLAIWLLGVVAPVATAQGVKVDDTPRSIISSAFSSELYRQILPSAEIEGSIVVEGVTYYWGTYEGDNVVMFLTGVSEVNAAINTERAFDLFNIVDGTFSGIAGGIDPALDVGDVVIPAGWVPYLESYIIRETGPGVFSPPAWVQPYWPNYEWLLPDPQGVPSASGQPDNYVALPWYTTDEVMLDVMRRAVGGVDLIDIAGRDPVIHIGDFGITGSAFLDNAEVRTYAHETFGAVAVAMEDQGVLHVCHIHNVPCVIVRSLSDLAGGEAGGNVIGEFFGVAADNSATVLQAFFQNYTPYPEEEFVFGMVLVGPRNDHGWSEAHYIAGQYVEEHLPNTRMVVFESLNPADAPETTLAQVVEEMAAEGARLIITTSDAFEEDTLAVAEANPEIVFINASGDDVLTGEAPENEGNVMGAMEWGKQIAGCAAALATETGNIGYLGPLINHETRRLAASAYLGARYCYETYRDGDPDKLSFTVTWIGFWFNIPGVTLDPTEETNRFFDQGADVVLSGIDTTEALVVAGQRAIDGEAVWAIPYDFEDACEEAPEVCLGVPYFNWGPAYLEATRRVINDVWEPTWEWNSPWWGDLTDNGRTAVGWVTGLGFPEDQTGNLNEFIAWLASQDLGNINAETLDEEGRTLGLWIGPLNLQDGTVLAEDDEIVPLSKVWYLEQLLEGMTGQSN